MTMVAEKIKGVGERDGKLKLAFFSYKKQYNEHK